MVGLGFEDPGVFAPRLWIVAHSEVDLPQEEAHGNIVGGDLEGALQIASGLVVPAQVIVADAAEVVHPISLGFFLEQRVGHTDRTLEVLGLVEKEQLFLRGADRLLHPEQFQLRLRADAP